MACIASILEEPLDAFPTVAALRDGDWWSRTTAALRARGWAGVYCLNTPDAFYPAGYHVALGKSPRGLHHAVVALDGKTVHDPHPSRDGILEVSFWIMLWPLASTA